MINHKGRVKALSTQFQEVAWQQCQTHLTRNILSACPQSQRAALHNQLRRLFEAETPQAPRHVLSYPGRLRQIGSEGLSLSGSRLFDDAMAVLCLLERYRKRLRTINSQERLNEEIRRRECVIQIVPNTASAERLLGHC